MHKRRVELLYDILSIDEEDDKFGSNFCLTGFDWCVILKLRYFI